MIRKMYYKWLRKKLIDFMNFVSKTPLLELEYYSNDEFVDGYINQLIKTKLL